MKTRMSFIFALLFAIFATACGASPETVAGEFQTAVNTQDIETAMGLMAEDVVLQLERQSVTGQADVQDWLKTQAELDFEFDGMPAVTDGGVNYENCIIRSDVWSYFKLKEMTGTCQLELDGGSITGFFIKFDEVSTARLEASSAILIADLMSIWTSQWPAPGTTDEDFSFTYYYLQFNEDGSGRLALTPEDLTVSPDAEHTGARLVWNYDGFVLTLQNDGAATEGYCLEEEVGMFLVRKDGDGGIEFKHVDDPCSWRYFALERQRSSWDPYVP